MAGDRAAPPGDGARREGRRARADAPPVPSSRPALRALLDERDVRPSRARGQNFVVDPNTLRRVARLAGVGPGDVVIEVGAGPGALTAELARTGASVTAVEIDRRLVPALRTAVEPLGVSVVEADATTLDWHALVAAAVARGPQPSGSGRPEAVLVGNLPYRVATTIVLRVLDEEPAVTRVLVMVQREVGERLAAGAGSGAYGAVTVKVAYHGTARIVGSVPRSVFHPRPNVESVLVEIRRRPSVAVDPAVVDPARLFEIVRAGFAQRRKMLRRALAGVVEAGALERAGIDPAARAENLDVEAWGRLAAADAAHRTAGRAPNA